MLSNGQREQRDKQNTKNQNSKNIGNIERDMPSQKHKLAQMPSEHSLYTLGRSRTNDAQVRKNERQVLDISSIRKMKTADTLREVRLDELIRQRNWAEWKMY